MAIKDFAALSGVQRKPSAEDIAYLRRQCPFLEVVGVMLDDDAEVVVTAIKTEHDAFSKAIDEGVYGIPALIELKSSWSIHYWPKTETYPPAMTIAASSMLGETQPLVSEEPISNGTVSTYAFHAAAEMVLLALTKSWQGIQIVNGDALMQWALWAVAERNHLPVYGYEPDGDDQAKAERVADIIDRHYLYRPAAAPTPSPQATGGHGGDVGADSTDET